MKIAIIGAGFSGLAVCWHLLQQQPLAKVTLFDPKGIGGGTSGMAAGLMHPFTGPHATYNWMGWEGMQASHKLFQISSAALQKEVASELGLLRLACTQEQVRDYQTVAEKQPHVLWCSPEKCQELIPGVSSFPGIFIRQGTQVFCSLYLQGLWQACQNYSVQLEKRSVQTLQELEEYEWIIVTAGVDSKKFSELGHLTLTPVKGQLLTLSWPEREPPLPLLLNSQAYLVMDPSNRFCVAGATFERKFTSDLPDLPTASAEILPKVHQLYPALKEARVVACQAGMRASTPNRLPIYGQAGKKVWYLTGLGSKGLLYHALMAEKLVKTLPRG